MLLASQELDRILAGLGLLQRCARDAVGKSARFHRIDYSDMQVLEIHLGPLGMLAAAIGRSVLEDVVLDCLAARDHSSVADSPAAVLLLHTLELGKKIDLADRVGNQAVVAADIVQNAGEY